MADVETLDAEADHRSAGERRPVGRVDRQVVRQARGADRRVGVGRQGRSRRAARAQRRGQDHDILFGDGAGEARLGPDHARRRGHHHAADVPARDPGAGLSAAGNVDLPRAVGREEHLDRARIVGARQGGAGGAAGDTARRIRPDAAARCARDGAVGRRAAAGGNRARAGRDPSIILLDEPFAGIDPICIADIRDLVSS